MPTVGVRAQESEIMAAIFARNTRSGTTVRRGQARATQLPSPTPTAAEMMRDMGIDFAAPAAPRVTHDVPGPPSRPRPTVAARSVESVEKLESLWDYEDAVDAALEDLMRSKKRS